MKRLRIKCSINDSCHYLNRLLEDRISTGTGDWQYRATGRLITTT